MAYLIGYNDLFMADLFPVQWTTKPTDGIHFETEEEAINNVFLLTAKWRSKEGRSKNEIILSPDDFMILWIDSDIFLTEQKPTSDED